MEIYLLLKDKKIDETIKKTIIFMKMTKHCPVT